ncbi:MAG: molybdate ABC transporter permease subunit [Deltaproteobacteria bacterium]|nr:molybdate ABC transporter permease subunit [Deltaproteobacteria bacterium]
MEIFGVNIGLGPIWLTLKVAFVTTSILLFLGTPLAWAVARMRSRFKIFIEAVVALPLVLPPTVLGFYLLIVLNPDGLVTGALRLFGFEGQLTFSFTGLVIGSVFYSLPFTVQPLMHAFEAVPQKFLDAAAMMRASALDRFFTVVVPLSRQGFFVAGTLTFAHTVGEFGVVLMIGGNIPEKTRLVSIDIFNHVETLAYSQAHLLSGVMLLFSLAVLLMVYSFNFRLGLKFRQ